MDLDLMKRWMSFRTWYLKAVLPLPYPAILNIEPTNRCNLACTMCPRSGSSRAISDLPWETFETLCQELKREGPILKVFLQKDGEPLLHPRIVDMVRRLREVNAARAISIITNGTLLTPALFESLAKAGLHDLIVSIDACDSASYRSLKGADRFELVTHNVQAASALKKKHGWRYPLIKARMVARKHHEADVAAFKSQWKSTADAVDITPYHTWMGTVKDERCYERQDRYPCALLWYTGIINSDGRGSPCCIDFDQAGAFPLIGTSGFRATWNGPALRQLRMQHLLGRYQDTAICSQCEYWLIKENLGSWLRRKFRVAPISRQKPLESGDGPDFMPSSPLEEGSSL
jgi:organic radical activating enzyme